MISKRNLVQRVSAVAIFDHHTEFRLRHGNGKIALLRDMHGFSGTIFSNMTTKAVNGGINMVAKSQVILMNQGAHVSYLHFFCSKFIDGII